MIDYDGQVALVTGGASGIGRALVADIDGDGAAATAAQAGGAALQVDLAEPGAVTGLLDRAWGLAGKVDFIASNAGMGSGPGPKRLLKADLDAPRVAAMFEVNMFAAIRLAQAYVPRLDAAGRRGRPGRHRRHVLPGSGRSAQRGAGARREPGAMGDLHALR